MARRKSHRLDHTCLSQEDPAITTLCAGGAYGGPNQILVLKTRNSMLCPCLWEINWQWLIKEKSTFLTHTFWNMAQSEVDFSFVLSWSIEKMQGLMHHEQHVMLDQDRLRLCLLLLAGSGPLVGEECYGGSQSSLLTLQEACRVRRAHFHRWMGQNSLNRWSCLLLQKCLGFVQAVTSLPLFSCSSMLKTAINPLPALSYENYFLLASSKFSSN